jgi:hypothetical protein
MEDKIKNKIPLIGRVFLTLKVTGKKKRWQSTFG